MTALGAQVPGQRFKELGALAGLGAAEQTQQQRALDLGYRQFLEEQAFPMKTLQDYSSVLRGFPLPPTQTIDKIAYSPVAPLSSQLLGAAQGLGSIAALGGAFGSHGGQVAQLQQGGLASMYRPTNRVQFGRTNYQDVDDRGWQYAISPGFGKFMGDWKARIEEGQALESAQNKEFWKRNWLPERLWTQFTDGPAAVDTLHKENLQIASNINALQAAYDKKVDAKEELKKEEKKLAKEKKFAESDEGKALAKHNADMEEQREKLRKDLTDMRESQQALIKKDEEASERRIRYKTWIPVLKNAGNTMNAPDLTSAISNIFASTGAALEGQMAGEADEVTMRAAQRKAALENGFLISQIAENFSPDKRLISMAAIGEQLKIENYPQDDKLVVAFKENFRDALKQVQGTEYESMVSNYIDMDQLKYLGLLTDPSFETYLTKQQDTYFPMAPAPATSKTGGAVKLKKGESVPAPEPRSFDFVERGGKLIAVPS